MISKKRTVQYLHKFAKEFGLKNWVFSPGSRNAPITLTIGNDNWFQSDVIVDERVAGFVALGQALKSKRPSVLCCTSGSASLNYAPSISEAFYQEIPMLVVTADRPRKWIGNGEGQSIDQVNVYSNYVVKSFHIDDDSTDKEIMDALNGIAESFNSGKIGPIHLNIGFEEPLYEVLDKHNIDYEIEATYKRLTNSEDISSELQEKWRTKEKVLILCGQNTKDEGLHHQLKELMNDRRVVVMTETTSNLFDFNFVNNIDRTLALVTGENFYPDLVITIGGAIVSKKIKGFLRSIENLEHWQIHESANSVNVFEKLTTVIEAAPSSFFKSLNEINEINIESYFQSNWMQAVHLSKEKHMNFLSDLNWSDLKVFDIIQDTLPEGVVLHQGNSSPVRYFQLFNPIPSVEYYANRGVSGIDGCISTAIGYASLSEKFNVVVLGDLSFVYDSNAFWNQFDLKNLLVIVINNGGGGIFKIIEGPSKSGCVEKFFEVGNAINLNGLASAYGVGHNMVQDEDALESQLARIYNEVRIGKYSPEILEIDTTKIDSSQVLKRYFEFLKS